jgi:hypothetical protein
MDALDDYLEILSPGTLAQRETRARMFGADGFIDSPCWRDYDPWDHAESVGAAVVYREELPRPEMVACYSSRYDAIFIRSDAQGVIERCALTHELVHFEHKDVGTTKIQEDRADRLTAMRLIRPSRVEQIASDDPGEIGLELRVTEKVMRTYARMVRHGWRMYG